MFAFPPAPSAPTRSFLTRPDVHGDLVAFTCGGDLWTGDLKTGAARRLTSDPGTETNARFSPDGSTLAFTANYDGGSDVYVMPVGGGAPKRLTYDPAGGATVQGWTPDGKAILFRSLRDTPVGRQNKLFTVPAGGGLAKAIPVPHAEFGRLSPDGRLAYVPISNEWMNWFDYRAGAADQVWLADLKGGFRKLAASAGVETTPTWCGEKLFFVSERTGTRNLYRLGLDGKATPVTKYADAPVRYPSADAHRVVFEHGAGLALYDADSGETRELRFDLASDRIADREVRFPLARYAMHPALGPTGKRILMEARGQIVSVAATDGDLRVLEKKAGARAMNPVWSPDGKRFAFLSDRTGEMEVWTGAAEGGGEPTQLTRGLAAEPFAPIWSPDGARLAIVDREGRLRLVDVASGAITPVDVAEGLGSYDNPNQQAAFSPDGRLLVFSHAEAQFVQTVVLYEIATGKRATLSPPGVYASAPTFSADGKFVVYLLNNQLAPSEVPITGKYVFDNTTKVAMQALARDTASPFLPKSDEEGAVAPPAPGVAVAPSRVDWEGLADRRIETPVPAGRYTFVAHVPGKILLLNGTGLAAIGGGAPSEVVSFDMAGRTMTRICDADAFEASRDGKKLMIVRGGAGVSVVDAGTGPTVAPPIPLSAYTLTVEPEAEWRQIFAESWRVARDFYYDPGMHGLDWAAVRRKYEARLPLVGDRTDLTRLLVDMVSELRTGHAYVSSPPAAVARIPMGFLGADLAPEGDAARIVKLYRGDGYAGDRSPLLEPGLGVEEGDYILAIAGQPIRSDQDPQALLVGLVGQTVAIMVNDKPTMVGARTIRVRPLASERALRYADWVVGRAAYVKRNGGADLGYAHIPDMMAGGLVGFTKGQYANLNADGMVYDFRYNTGGYVSALLLQDIAAVPGLDFSPRAGAFWHREDWAIAGYKVALCNEQNFSDGELVIEDWKRLGLGPVVGKRTGGGEVGSGGGYNLVDGGKIYIPNYGAFGEKGWVIEGYGATPTVEVDEDPAAVMAGRDPQLDKAIALLKASIAKEPVRRPVRPPFPRG